MKRPGGHPPSTARLNSEVVRALNAPDVHAKLDRQTVVVASAADIPPQ
jgi:hypothetical protein